MAPRCESSSDQDQIFSFWMFWPPLSSVSLTLSLNCVQTAIIAMPMIIARTTHSTVVAPFARFQRSGFVRFFIMVSSLGSFSWQRQAVEVLDAVEVRDEVIRHR